MTTSPFSDLSPPRARYGVVAITAIAAMWMYIDRVCFSTLADPIQKDLELSESEKARILGAFFFTYALFQIPMGSLADRFGARSVLALSIAAWSAVTAATGFADGFVSLVVIRLLLGVTEAGAYPAAAGLVKRWALPEERGLFSSAVALGGRIGGAIAPALTAGLSLALAGVVLGGWSVGPSGSNWRAVFALYGVCGLAVAVGFWLWVRDHPPTTRRAEQAPNPGPSPPGPSPLHNSNAEGGRSPSEMAPASPASAMPTTPPTLLGRLRIIAATPRMWTFGTLQFCNNVSWAFLVTLLPTFLKDSGLPLDQRGHIQTLILVVGCVGMLMGGFVTDRVYRRLGPRWGRSLPAMTVMSGCALMCLVLAGSPPLPVAILCLAVMALCQDLGIPSVWAYAQDVGGRNVGAVLGFGNMLGNFGAALSPVLLTWVRDLGGWSAAFALCAGAYTVSILSAYTLDSSRPIRQLD